MALEHSPRDLSQTNDDEAKAEKDQQKQKLKYEVSQEMGILTKQNYKK
ncbi:MAG: hypothetical protein GX133_02685 [Syntrophomonadaceae bacterium]|nr:hypothetical protein [Syntrophomonadaceae bacterium]